MTKKQKPKISDDVQKIIELEDKLARSLADYANLAKRIEEQKQFFVALASASIMGKIIEALDDLYLASNHLKDQGLDMALDKLKNALKSEGLEEIEALGKIFDPKTMDCVNVAKGEQDTVVSISKKGYLLNGECLRPAQVVVGKN
jgi:molecular chaperone GrpE